LSIFLNGEVERHRIYTRMEEERLTWDRKEVRCFYFIFYFYFIFIFTWDSKDSKVSKVSKVRHIQMTEVFMTAVPSSGAPLNFLCFIIFNVSHGIAMVVCVCVLCVSSVCVCVCVCMCVCVCVCVCS